LYPQSPFKVSAFSPDSFEVASAEDFFTTR
jgi:hypothetical protein